MRGKVSEGATTHLGSAVLLNDQQSDEVARLIAKKYSIGVKLLDVMSFVKKILGRGSTAGDAAIKVTLHS
jgi:hypothetical protein